MAARGTGVVLSWSPNDSTWRSSTDPERTTGLLISTRQQECWVCASKWSVMSEQTQSGRLNIRRRFLREEKDTVCCCGGRWDVNKESSAAAPSPGNVPESFCFGTFPHQNLRSTTSPHLAPHLETKRHVTVSDTNGHRVIEQHPHLNFSSQRDPRTRRSAQKRVTAYRRRLHTRNHFSVTRH